MGQQFALCESEEDAWKLVCCTHEGGLQTLLYGSHSDVQRCKNTEPVQLSDAFTTTVNANRTCNRVHTDLGWRACKTRPDGNCLLHSLAAGSVRAKMIFDKFD